MRADHKTIIIGAGFGGIGLGVQLLESGNNDFIILEKASRVGGTWRDNTYPGAGCDVQSHLYCYSFAPNPAWSRVYSPQPEILAYIDSITERFRLTPHIRLNSEATDAVWDEAQVLWRVTLADGTTLTARVLVTAWGQLNRPAMPDIRGLEGFAGPQFHSARWRHDLSLAGKRVGCIGSAASAVQLVPPVAQEAAHLTLFQRSPNWVVPRMNRAYTPEEVSAFQADPTLVQTLRDGMYTEREGRVGRTRLDNNVADETRRVALAHLAAQVPDPALRARLTPDYAIGCRRILVSDDFYPALTRDNVAVVTERILRATPDGIVTADGTLHPLDALIFATGFETHSFLGLADVTGRDERSLRTTWQEGAVAYAGLSVAGFPNMFMLYGPNTNLGHSSIIAMLEAQYQYILQALNWLDGKAGRSLEVQANIMSRFNETLQQELQGSAWTANCNSWYKTASGRIVNNWSGTVDAYRHQIAQFRLEDYDLRDGSR